MLDQLSTLAMETSSDKRRELMGAVADLFTADSEHFNDRELFLFGEILTVLLDDVDIPAKVQLSETLAQIDNTPRDLVLSLVDEEIEVAVPVLRHSKVLTDEDLVEIASTKTTDHRLAISDRENLNIVVTDALLAHGEQPVFHSVCGNKTAKISNDGFHVLADSAVDDQVMYVLLSNRADLPVDVVRRVLPAMSESARQRLKEVVEANGESVVADLLKQASKKSKDTLDSSKWGHIQSKALLGEIMSGAKELEPAVTWLSQENRLIDVASILAGYTGLPENQVLNALMKKNGQPIAVLCRGLDFSEETFSAIVEMRAKRLRLTTSECAASTLDYASYDASSAKRTMRFVKVRNSAHQA